MSYIYDKLQKMTEGKIKELFKENIQDRGVYAKIGVSRDVVYNWKHGRGTAPTIGQMLETLYRLDIITIEVNRNLNSQE